MAIAKFVKIQGVINAIEFCPKSALQLHDPKKNLPQFFK